MAQVKSIGKFKTDNRTILQICPGLSGTTQTVRGGASYACYANGIITVDINNLSYASLASGHVLAIRGFKNKIRIVDASYISKVAEAGVIRVFADKTASVATMLNFATNIAANKLTKPASFFYANTVVDAGGVITVRGILKAGKGTLVLVAQPF